MRRRYVLCLVSAAIVQAACTPHPPQHGFPAQLAQVDSLVRLYMRAQHIPGMSVALGINGHLAWAQGFGFADLENRVPTDTETVFPTASTLKPLTATAVLRLVDAGKLDLDAPVQRYCAAYPTKPGTVTPRLLMLHQGGIRPSSGRDVFNREHYTTVAAAVSRFAGDSLRFEPGSATLYSNEGFALLACAIEGASGQSYDSALRHLVLAPSGMRSTSAEDVYRVTPHVSRSYLVRTAANTRQWQGLWTQVQLASTAIDSPAVADPIDTSWEPGAGNYRSTPADMVRFVLALEHGNLLSDSLRTREFTNATTKNGARTGRGYGWTVSDTAGPLEVSMLGSNWDGSFGVFTLPQEELVIALASNIEFNIPAGLVQQIATTLGYKVRAE